MSALGYASKALTLAQAEPASVQRVTDVATAHWLQGEALLRLDRAKEAGPILDEALNAAIASAPNSKLHADLLMAQGGLMEADGEVQRALSDFQNAYRIFGAVGQLRGQAKALQFMGAIYEDAGDYARVLKYYEQSAELYPNDPALLMAAYNNTAFAYKAQKMFPAAEADFRRALAVAREMKSLSLEARILSNLASVQVEEAKFGAAARSVALGLRAAAADPDGAQWRPYLWGVSARAAMKQGQLEAARALLERMFQGVDLRATSITYRDFHRTAYETYVQLGDDQKALTHLTALKRLDDQAAQLAVSTNSALMSAQFDYANQVTRIAQLKAGQYERDIELARTRNAIQLVLLGAASAISILMAGAFLWIRRSRNEIRLANAELGAVNRSLEKALRTRSEFLATTSHEIRTPLNGILGMTQVMLANRTVEPALREQIRLVHTSGETMRDLVNDILDVAKIENGKLEIDAIAFDLQAVLTEAIELWRDRAREKGLELALDLTEAPRMIVGDPSRIRQVVVNLVSNAIKFTESGKVTVTARGDAAPEKPVLVLTVSDTGIGISQDDATRVFESFSQIDSGITRLYSGTGLGLTICKSVTEAMGGEISLSSAIGEGSVFTLRVPLQEATDVAEVSPEPFKPAVGLQDCLVLVVDPNLLSQSIMRAMLGEKVRAIETASTAEEALELLERTAFDLVLTDCGAVSADPASKQDRLVEIADRVTGSVAVLAAQPSLADVAALQARGARVVISKPVSASSLVQQLEAAYATAGLVDEADRACSSAA